MENVKRIESRLVISLVGMAAFFVILFGIRASASIINPILLAVVITITVLPIPSKLKNRGLPGWLALVLTILMVVVLDEFRHRTVDTSRHDRVCSPYGRTQFDHDRRSETLTYSAAIAQLKEPPT